MVKASMLESNIVTAGKYEALFISTVHRKKNIIIQF